MRIAYIKGIEPETAPAPKKAKAQLHLDAEYIRTLAIRQVVKHNQKFQK